MSHAFTVSDEQYHAIEEAAKERGLAPDDFFQAWVEAVRQRVEAEEIDPDQAWFWTPEWQAKEREADAALASGHFTRYESDEAFLEALEERSKHADS